MGLEDSSVDHTLHSIAARLRTLDAAIRDLVTKHQEELLAQAGQTAELKQSVQGIDARTERLLKASGRIRRELLQPFADLKGHVLLLERLQAAADLLRRVMRVTFNIRKLKATLTKSSAGGGGEDVKALASPDFSAIASFDSRELGKAAQMLYDIEQYTAPETPGSAQLLGVQVVQCELPWLAEAGKAIRARAVTLLYKGMDTLNHGELGSALQVSERIQKRLTGPSFLFPTCLGVYADLLGSALFAGAC
jgi:hypothetical protein